MRYDTTLKDVFQGLPQFLLRLLTGRQAVDMLPVEFPATQKRQPDLVFLLDNGTIFHLELQSTPEIMVWRMLIYYALIRLRYPNHKLVQMVLYVGHKPWRKMDRIVEERLQFQYDVVDIRNIDCREILASPSLEENMLAVLCHQDDARQTIRHILHRIDKLPPKARADALTRLVILSELRKLETVVHEEVQEMAITFNVMENDVLRDLFLKAQKESEERGEEQGEKKGRASALLLLMEGKFGKLPDEIQQKIFKAGRTTLEKWLVRVLKANTLEEVFQGSEKKQDRRKAKSTV
ncbi:MAG: hypothetical protein H7833_19885 [Magnetococcus sp. DMHC-1]